MKINPLKILALFLSLVFTASSCNNSPKLVVSGHVVRVEVVKTAQEQEKGLGGRNQLLEDGGMLFVFNDPQKPMFWMKDMKLDIDIIWIKDDKIVEITENVQPQPGVLEGKLQIYSPQQEVDMVLEVNAGWVKRRQIPIGGPVDLIW